MAPGTARAQAIERPADERPSLDVPDAPGRVPIEIPVVPRPPRRKGPLAAGLQIVLSAIRVEGATVFDTQDFRPITRPFENRSVASNDLQDLTDEITRLYNAAGYVSSGAFIPDQDLAGGVLVVRAVEARLVQVVVHGNRWHEDRYLERRLLTRLPGPIRVQDLEAELQILIQDRDIKRVAGELQPGPLRGEDVLVLTIEEGNPFGVVGIVGNDNSPGVGEVRGRLYAEDRNVFGYSDSFQTRFDFTEGLATQELRYSGPINGYETTLGIRFRHTDSEVVQSPFDELDIDAETWTGGLRLTQPVLWTPSTRLDLSLVAERRRSTTWQDGDRFSFVEGPDDGRSDVTVFRLGAEGSWRSPTDVIAARSLVSIGVDIWNATDNSGNLPDGRYVAWLSQAQWAHRFPDWLLGSQFVARADAQITNNALLSLERIAIGGVSTVRGYQENLLVRDNAVILSGELRIPVIRGRLGEIQVAPFFDWGKGWNKNRIGANEATGQKGQTVSDYIYSAGVGLRYQLNDTISAYGYWGEALKDVPDTGENIQEDGFHLGIRVRAF